MRDCSASKVCAPVFSTARGDQAAHFGPAHAFVPAEQVGQRFDHEQVLGILLVDLAGQLWAEHPDTAGFQLQHRSFALHPRSQALGSNGAAFIRHPLHAVRSGRKGLERRVPSSCYRSIAGLPDQNSTQSGQVFHTALLVRMDIQSDAQCSGESFHFHSFACCVVMPGLSRHRLDNTT
jgi:hypothetical protein